MSWPRGLAARLRGLFMRDRLEHQLDDELRFHLEMQIEDNLRMGMEPEEARNAARRQFGGMESMKERYRDTRGLPWLDGIVQDFHYAVRTMRRSPGTVLTTVATLALGIGVNTAVFTAYKAMVARPLNARAPAELVNLALARDLGAVSYSFSYPDYEALRDSLHSFSGLIAYRPAHVALSFSGTVGQDGTTKPETVSVFVVSENYFKVLGIAAIQGHTFESIEPSELAVAPAVLISENYWQTRFSGDPTIIGRTVHLNGLAVNVVGITPRDFVGTGISAPSFWLPVGIEPLLHADNQWLRDRETQRFRLFGRLASGVSIGQAQAEVSLIADRLRTSHDPNSEWAKPATALVWPGSPFPLPLKYYDGLTVAILLIMAAAGMVLAVACANVGSLQLARTRSRKSELRTRMSLGASRLRVIRQLVTESVVVGLLAGVAALFFTWAFLKISVILIARVLPGEFGALVFDVAPDLRIFAFVLAVSLVAGLLSGVVPAIESSRAALFSGVKGGTSSARSRAAQDLLVAVQVALSLVLMIAGGMAIHSSINSLTIDTGYNAKHVIDINLQFPETSQYDEARKRALVQMLRTQVAALPGVTTITSAMPPGDGGFQTAAAPSGETDSRHIGLSILHYARVQANYFELLGIPLIRGHSFSSPSGPPDYSVIVSESAAKQLWPGQSPLGRSLRLGATDEHFRNQTALLALGVRGPAYEVVGIVRDTRGAEFDASDTKRIYLPLPLNRLQGYHVLVRTQSNPRQITNAINPAISAIDPNTIATISTLEEMLRRGPVFVISTIAAAIASAVGLLGLFLAVIGIYGTVSYIVVLRTQEVGIRMAIGAQKRDVLELILRESTRPVLAGLIAGTLLAAGASYLARGLLYGIDGMDGVSVASVSLLFFVVALFAAYPPARRAMRVDPVVALRYE